MWVCGWVGVSSGRCGSSLRFILPLLVLRGQVVWGNYVISIREYEREILIRERGRQADGEVDQHTYGVKRHVYSADVSCFLRSSGRSFSNFSFGSLDSCKLSCPVPEMKGS